jgi:hypothetical protein
MRDESSDPSGIDATEGLVALLTGSPYRGRERGCKFRGGGHHRKA